MLLFKNCDFFFFYKPLNSLEKFLGLTTPLLSANIREASLLVTSTTLALFYRR